MMNTFKLPHLSSRHGLDTLFLALLLALLASPVTTTAQSLQGLADDGSWLRVTNNQDGFHLERAGAAPLALPLAKGSVVTDLRQSTNTIWLAAVEPTTSGPQIAILKGQGDQLVRLPQLPEATGRLLREPTLLTDSQGLRAILWLTSNAPRRQALYASRFDGQDWQEAIAVAPPGPGSQIALTATILEDGSWLAAWAAFDGEDTEIMWSRAVDGQWSTPSPVAPGNQVPDITPHLLVVHDGALLAWSRYDGNDYRVLTARFAEGVWQAPHTVGGPGTLYPTFQPGEMPVLVFQQVIPAAWEVIALDGKGQLKYRYTVATDHQEPPLVERVDAQGALVAWSPSGAKAADRVQIHWPK
jgi:hypothetical protein